TSTLPTALVLPTTESVIDTTLALAPSTTKPVSTAPTITENAFADQVTTASGTRGSATTQAELDKQQDNNNVMTAGIAIGVLAGVLCVFVLAWFFFNRRRKQIENRKLATEDDEKINGPINPFADSAAIRTPTNAPRLSLRPVTQFLPTFPDRRVSRGANMMLSAEPQGQNSPLHKPAGASAWERPTLTSTTGNGTWDRPGTAMSATPSNPFGDNQRIMEDPEREAASGRPVSPPTPPQKNIGLVANSGYSPEPVSPVDGSRQEFPTGAAVAASAVATGAAAGLVRKASIRKDLPRPLDLTMPMPPAMSGAPAPPSPAGTEFSMHSVAPGQPIGPSSSAAAIAAAGGPPQSTVHRVTLDFKPTLDDEMGLTAGQLVRLLHEYDDGWALCIRLDRSQQGVVPRTCLSTRPVKPRPPPGGPRGPPGRPQSPSGMNRRMSPPGPNNMGRGPVPGQAY
ncbi:hypothetical protein B0T14DRAFT_408824, partial [Immersiella caudata]